MALPVLDGFTAFLFGRGVRPPAAQPEGQSMLPWMALKPVGRR